MPSSPPTLAPLESLSTLDSLTLPNIRERLPSSATTNLDEQKKNPYLLPVGRKWETAKSRRKKKKKLAKKRAMAKRSPKSQSMADLQSSLVTPGELAKLSNTMSYDKTKDSRIATFDPQAEDEQSFASSNDDSTIEDVHR